MAGGMAVRVNRLDAALQRKCFPGHKATVDCRGPIRVSSTSRCLAFDHVRLLVAGHTVALVRATRAESEPTWSPSACVITMSVTSAALRPISSTAARITSSPARHPGIDDDDCLAEQDARPSDDLRQVVHAITDLLHVVLLWLDSGSHPDEFSTGYRLHSTGRRRGTMTSTLFERL